jgi:squalene-hopene/tetraprenyl-beta-curcumene cyclase
MFDRDALEETIANLVSSLLSCRVPGGWWEGRLSSSALSTATAVSALTLAGGGNVDPGLAWLAHNQNADGGWGDTVLSGSNISTTLLCWCAFSITHAAERYKPTNESAEAWLRCEVGSLEPAKLVDAILRSYGNDRTFSVPILTVMAIAGKLGAGRDAWRSIPQLPFELAAFPHQFFGWLRLPVVSYALPALIAIGQVRHHCRPSRNPLLRAARNRLVPGTLRLLRGIQPSTGGYLEATPLTSFVVMSLASAGRKNHDVVVQGVRFLRNSMRPDGSWPIDTNLSTWVTTLSVNALAGFSGEYRFLDNGARHALHDWLLAQQYREEHPYTHAAPGGWAWTPLPGGVPDADDTPGALLALRHLGVTDQQTRAAAAKGVRWLIGLQNSDGGMPTFCRGWGKLPFDRSGADLAAHALAAWRAWLPDLDATTSAATARASTRAVAYLERTQNPDGSWTPLWFGNECAPNKLNPTYGTARTVIALADSEMPMRRKAVRWLEAAQNSDGGWGGAPGTPSSIEETALAVHALCDTLHPGTAIACIERGIQWLMESTDRGLRTSPAPIGLYFAQLWYYEELYPLIFSVGATIRARRVLRTELRTNSRTAT